MRCLSTALACAAGAAIISVPAFALMAIWGGDERWSHTAATMFFCSAILGVAAIATSDA